MCAHNVKANFSSSSQIPVKNVNFFLKKKPFFLQKCPIFFQKHQLFPRIISFSNKNSYILFGKLHFSLKCHTIVRKFIFWTEKFSCFLKSLNFISSEKPFSVEKVQFFSQEVTSYFLL